MDIIAQLKAERDKAAQQVNALDTAIRALSGLNSTGATRGRWTMSAAARARIAAAQRARWAKMTEPQHGRDGQSGERRRNSGVNLACLQNNPNKSQRIAPFTAQPRATTSPLI